LSDRSFSFFFAATLDDQIVTVATQEYDIKSITYELLLHPMLKHYNASSFWSNDKKKGKKLDVIIKQGEAGGKAKQLKNFALWTSLESPVRIQVEFSQGGCNHSKPASNFNLTSEQYDHDWCFELPSVSS